MAKKEKKKSTFWADFKAFISRGNVVDMAIGVAVAGAFTAIVSAFTAGFISPLLALLTNDADLSSMTLTLREAQTHVDVVDGVEVEVVDKAAVLLGWGNFVQKIIDFLIIAFVLFLIMRIVKSVTTSVKKAQTDVANNMKSANVKAEEAAAAKAAEEAAAAEKAAAEAAAAEAAAKAAEEEAAKMESYKAQVAVAENTERLLTEIRDLLKAQAK